MIQTSMKNANLRGADLKRASFTEVDLSGADLSGCRVEEATFKKVIIDNNTRLPSTLTKEQLKGFVR
jgi:uncharacterized protein YjbI with pentapeptide repeats